MCVCVCHHACCYIGWMTNLNSVFMTMTTCTCAGPTSASMKLHLLSHVVPCVRNWGPVWVYSCFQFESQNHSIKKLFHGSKNTSSMVSQTHTCTCIFLALSLAYLPTIPIQAGPSRITVSCPAVPLLLTIVPLPIAFD